MSKFAKNFEVEKGMYQNVPNKVRGFLSSLFTTLPFLIQKRFQSPEAIVYPS